jgi:hypothetical protein
MLNRMMFIYFIQKKGFLDGDVNYLRTRLQRMQHDVGPDRFQRFYRLFLLRLFHEGLGVPEQGRAPELAQLLGRVPYLNGGLFDVHELERTNDSIHIPDQAFQDIFDFFDTWQWHLDERPLRNDREINPDVLGYIFEKYINQKQMGAYYSKEDITGYMTQHAVIPHVFEAAEAACPIAFTTEAGVWRLLRQDPDRYIQDFVRHGCDIDLPENIAAGLSDIAQRDAWDARADATHALPNETWREHVARREQYHDAFTRLASGSVHSVNDCVTLNLNLQRVAEDVITQSEGPELVRAFWMALTSLSVLDPTCGSGAFLFAALNILEPLYEACLDGMQGFVDDLATTTRQRPADTLVSFRDTLEHVARHANRRYFVLRSIVVRNLYGMDIMKEAAEICKLRLFLKLVAQLTSSAEIEPLPDIDFNIRVGNALVGYVLYDEVRHSATASFDFANVIEKVQAKAADLQEAFDAFRTHQVDEQSLAQSEEKEGLRGRLAELTSELNVYLAREYGVEPQNQRAYSSWLSSHQPFHWFAEFYGIIAGGGFDVIIGNPPYVEYRTVSDEYTVRAPQLVDLGNLHAMVTLRCLSLLSASGSMSLIVPVALPSTDRFVSLRDALAARGAIWLSHYDFRPAKLFEGSEQRLTILVLRPAATKRIFTTKYNRWYGEERPTLFARLAYTEWADGTRLRPVWPKLAGPLSASILKKVAAQSVTVASLVGGTGEAVLYYKNTGVLYYTMFTREAPQCFVNGRPQPSSRETTLKVRDRRVLPALYCALNSTLFYAMYQIHSNCRDLNPSDIQCFRLPTSLLTEPKLAVLANELHDNQQTHAAFRIRNQRLTGEVRIQTFQPAASKPVLDRIDTVLARHYGFTDEELDFIVHYDSKFRASQAADDD